LKSSLELSLEEMNPLLGKMERKIERLYASSLFIEKHIVSSKEVEKNMLQ